MTEASAQVTIPVLLVEDTQVAVARCKELLGKGFDVTVARNQRLAVPALKQMEQEGHPARCIIVDLVLDDAAGEGIELIEALRKAGVAIPIVVWTKHGPAYEGDATRAGATRYVGKYSKEETKMAEMIVDLIKGGRANDC